MTKPFVVAAAMALAVVALGATRARTTPTHPYDHVHLNVPDQAAAVAWYETRFGGTRTPESPDRLMFGSTRLVFLMKADAQPSAGSAVDHIGFSVRDLDATLMAFQIAGVKITTPAREVEGLFKLAFVEDPWGTRIEVVQDPDLLGFHHVHMRAPEPETVFSWLLTQFGGERAKLKGRIDGVKYGAPGFSDVWVLVQKGDAAPSEGHAIDHVGWRTTALDAKIAEMKTGGVAVTTEPRPLTLGDKSVVHYAYVAGPAGAKIELVQR
jgi:predicted enzyme related to lactoylglutathione lyase